MDTQRMRAEMRGFGYTWRYPSAPRFWRGELRERRDQTGVDMRLDLASRRRLARKIRRFCKRIDTDA